MNKHVLVFLLLFISGTLFAQQGSTLLYGNLYFQHAKNSIDGGDATWSWSVNPGIGYQFAQKWTAGLNLTYGQFKNGYTMSTIGGGPFVRYTSQLSDIFSIFGQLEGSYTVHDYSADPKHSTISIAVFPAIEMNLRKGFAINFGLGAIQYNTTRLKDRSGAYTTFEISFGSAATIGISKRFGGKQ